ncbi:hypothetical protein TNCV_3776491 [Trichonephila clavipes]|nr:hypothetical protein TNCV_3776491 [Trichonephila clavipes]
MMRISPVREPSISIKENSLEHDVENSQHMQPRATQRRFSVNVWVCILADFLIGLHFLSIPFDVFFHFFSKAYFLHGEVSPHEGIHVHLQPLDRYRGLPVHWPVRLLNLSCIDFFFDHIKSLEYETPIPLVEALVTRLSPVAGRIRNLPGIFQNVRNFVQCPFQAFQSTSNNKFEQLLQNNLSIKCFLPH